MDDNSLMNSDFREFYEDYKKLERKLKETQEAFLRTRDMLRGKSVSLRAFKIFDEELRKVGLLDE